MLVLLLHDFTDVFVYALKVAVDGASISTTLVAYFSHMFVWVRAPVVWPTFVFVSSSFTFSFFFGNVLDEEVYVDRYTYA